MSVLHGRYVTISRVCSNGSKLITKQRSSKDGRKLPKHSKPSKVLDKVVFLVSNGTELWIQGEIVGLPSMRTTLILGASSVHTVCYTNPTKCSSWHDWFGHGEHTA